jgi:hypothetical protein
MPVSYEIDRAQRLVIATLHGRLVDADIFEYQREVWSLPENVGYHELVDMSEITDVALVSAAGITDLAKLATSMDPAERSKLAIIAKTDLHFGLSRMYQFHRELSPQSTRTVRVFRQREEAVAWLGVTLPPVQS